jgi:hypothetical protein
MLEKKVFQRIDPITKRWIEPAEVYPSMVDNGAGYVLEYPITNDLVEAEPPTVADCIWENGAWKIAPLEIPAQPDPLIKAVVDDQGFFREQAIISAVWYEDHWVHLGAENPYYVDVLPEVDRVWHRPRWDGIKWVEGATAEEIAGASLVYPDWMGFIAGYIESDLDDLLLETSDKKALAKLNRALPMIEQAVIQPMLISAWNDCLTGLAEPLDAKNLKALKGLVKAYNIPFAVAADGQLRGD